MFLDSVLLIDWLAMAFVNGGNKVQEKEILVSEIKPGKRREFEMMMKVPAEWKMNAGERMVTRSQNGLLKSRIASDIVLDHDTFSGGESSSGLSSKKRKIEAGVFDEGKDDVASVSDTLEVNAQKGEGKREGDCVKPLVVYTRRRKAKSVDQMGREEGRFVREIENSQLNASSDGLGESGVIENDGRKDVASSGKVELKSPSRLKELLETGLLEGLPVKYIKGPKARVAGGPDFRGVIRGTKILCYCKECEGNKVVSPNTFEVHAGSGNKRPADYIYLDNGRSLRDVMNLCKGIPADLLEQAIQAAVNAGESLNCLKCKGSLPQSSTYARVLCGSCLASGESSVVSPVLSNASERPFSRDISEESLAVAAETCSTSGRSSLPRPSPKTVKLSSSGHSRSKGPRVRTMKDLRLHKLVFESDLLPDGTELAYFAHGKKWRVGYKFGDGICCECCDQVVSPSTFEVHAGFEARRKPYHHIYTSNRVSLHEWSLRIKERLPASTGESDCICFICEGDGELLCCDYCPRVFHKECLHLRSIPQGKWYCIYCEKEKRRMQDASNSDVFAAGSTDGVDPLKQTEQRCVRIVEPLAVSETECFLCRRCQYSDSGFGPYTVIFCDQCEREYHIGCLKDHGMDDLKELPAGEWFCSKECRDMRHTLTQLVDVGEQTLPHSMLSIIQKKQESIATSSNTDLSLTWRLIHAKSAVREHRKWLSGAVSVFHERFGPINESSSSRKDLIPTMVYGRDTGHKDFCGMYCATLILNSKVVSAGIFRIFGQELAEILLVATTMQYQSKGFFQCLFGCIVDLLSSLGVKEMVLPAATEAEPIWKHKFGFADLSDDQLDKYTKDYQLMGFEDSNMLHKPVPAPKAENSAQNA